MTIKTRDPVFLCKVTLHDSDPAIWRRFRAPGSLTLGEFHDVLQIVMGWTDSHLHRFTINGREYGRPDYEEIYEGEEPLRDERVVYLSELIRVVPSAFMCQYDYGDNWLHVIVVETYLRAGPDERYPICDGGARACPPEDVGGLSGYEEFLSAVGDPGHPDHRDMLTWAGGSFDPDMFDLAAVNRALKEM